MPDEAPEETPGETAGGTPPINPPPGIQNGDVVRINREIEDNDGTILNALHTLRPNPIQLTIGGERQDTPFGVTIQRTLNQGQWATLGWSTGTGTYASSATTNTYAQTIASNATYTIPVYTDVDLQIAYYYNPETDETHRRTMEDMYRARGAIPFHREPDVYHETVRQGRFPPQRQYPEQTVEMARRVNDARREQQQERQQRLDTLQRADAEFRTNQQRARTRARGLLDQFLTEAQKMTYAEGRYFDIVGSAGTVFRIRQGTSGNVAVLSPSTGEPMAVICAHPSGALPEADVHLSQMLQLMADEQSFITLANLHAGVRVSYLNGVVVDTKANRRETPEDLARRIGNQPLAA